MNFKLNSSTYKVRYTTLAVLVLHREISYGMGGYIKSDLKTDILEIEDEDNFLNRILNNYTNGLEAQKYGDFVGAYKYFYLVVPEGHGITSDKDLNLDLKILRHGASHLELKDKNLMDRAKELLGKEYVKEDGGKNTRISIRLSRSISIYSISIYPSLKICKGIYRKIYPRAYIENMMIL